MNLAYNSHSLATNGEPVISLPLPHDKGKSKPSHKKYQVRGETIVLNQEPEAKAYEVTCGEVLIIHNGRIVDLVEAGEILDTAFWPGAMMIARIDCVLKMTNGSADSYTNKFESIWRSDFESQIALAA